MILGPTFFIKNSKEAVIVYKKALGLTQGYTEHHPDGTYLHSELNKNGKFVFAVSETDNPELVKLMLQSSKYPTVNLGYPFDTKDSLMNAYRILKEGGNVLRPLGPLPWCKLSVDLVDKYGICWYLHLAQVEENH